MWIVLLTLKVETSSNGIPKIWFTDNFMITVYFTIVIKTCVLASLSRFIAHNNAYAINLDTTMSRVLLRSVNFGLQNFTANLGNSLMKSPLFNNPYVYVHNWYFWFKAKKQMNLGRTVTLHNIWEYKVLCLVVVI